MSRQTSRTQINSEKIISAYYGIIGEHHLENICHETDSRKNEIERVNVPKSMDLWFGQFVKNNKKRALRKNAISKIKNISSRAAAVLLILFTSFFILSMSVDAIRVKILNFYMKEHEKFTNVRIENSPVKSDSTIVWNDYYFPAYLPEGFKVESVNEIIETRIIDFSNKHGDHILFAQAPNGTDFQLDTENGIIEEVSINKYKGILIKKEGRNILFWYNEENSFYIVSGMNPEIILNIAQSIEKYNEGSIKN